MDDLLIYVTNPVVTVPNLIYELNCFGAVSNFKVRYDKSEALNISISTKVQQLLQKMFSFKWQEVAIKYLGVYIPRDFTKLQELNYSPIIHNAIRLLQKYDGSFFSWIERINIVNMDIQYCQKCCTCSKPSQ